MKKTFAELVDELTIVNIKIFMLVEKIQVGNGGLEDATKVQQLNSYRSELKNAINKELGGRQEIKV